MKTSVQILPGVKAIGWIECKLLKPNVALHGIAGSPLAILTEIHWIPFTDSPDCRCKTTKENGGYVDEASLKFASLDLLPRRNDIGFVVTDAEDRSYLIGAKEEPFPTMQTEIRFGSPDGDDAGFHYEITHTAIKSLLPCNIFPEISVTS